MTSQSFARLGSSRWSFLLAFAFTGLFGCTGSTDGIKPALLLRQCVKSKWQDDKLVEELMQSSPDGYFRDVFRFEREVSSIRQHKFHQLRGASHYTSRYGLYVSHLAYLHAKERDVRQFALLELFDSPLTREQKRQIMPILALQLFSGTLTERAVAAIMCGRLGAAGRSLIPYLVVGLYDDDEEMRRHCAKSISQITGEKFPLRQGVYPDAETVKAARRWAKNRYAKEYQCQ